MAQRAAVVILLLCLAGAAVFTFTPASGNGAGCGTWFNPAISDDAAQRTARLAERAQSFGSADLTTQAANLQRAVEECDAVLGIKQVLTFALLGLGVVIPGSVLFVAGGRKR